MGETPTSYPLHWPASWKRTMPVHRAVAKFHSWQSRGAGGSYRRPITVAEAVGRLDQEMVRLDARHAILSTNVEPTLAGVPRSDRREPEDPGVAVYFTLRGRRVVLACDRWTRVADNLTAVAKHIEAIRGQERWGVGSVEQAFFGYMSLPEPAQWFTVLGCAADAPLDLVEGIYRKLAKRYHPDLEGGDARKMAELTWAIQTARMERRSVA